MMASPDQQRHDMIEQAVLRLSAAPLDASILLWEALAAELIPVIGERGFASLYSRSLFRACTKFPWLAGERASDETFPMLAARLVPNDPAEAANACAGLLIIFTDTLILLIGELLTNSILSQAWGDDLVNIAGTEHRS
ncbi:MAG: hypothetical protein JWP34_1081 [Massilia sp.]|jgi:hypothetical protein|nr:hypothetical protein [Massilia sp.]